MLDSVQSQTKRSNLLIAKYIEATTMIYKYKNNILHRPGFESNNWWLSSVIRDCFYDIDLRENFITDVDNTRYFSAEMNR
jgi:hypothetical protein